MKEKSSAVQSLVFALAGGTIVLLAMLLAYRGVWPALHDASLLPWGSDTLGHLARYEYIKANIVQGNWYPQLMPDWYMGMQLLRYYAPLPYYILYGLDHLLGGSLPAIQGFVLFWTLFGGLSCLSLKRWVGALPAILGGVIYILLPDLIRVAYSEGNLPRVMAAALTPLLLYCALMALESAGKRIYLFGLALLFALITLTHAMMAAIFAAALAGMLVMMVATRHTSLRRSLITLAYAALGILLAGAWLLPSLTGGITELESNAVSSGLGSVPFGQLLDPLYRRANIETPYVSLALIVVAVLNLAAPWARSRLSIAASIAGLVLALLVTPQLGQLFSALPLSSLLWPVRFLGFASLLLLFAFLASLRGWWAKSPLIAVLLAALVLADCALSTRLVFVRPLNPALVEVNRAMSGLPGWREATLDESRLGSGPSWIFTDSASREQVFGWGYQGARTALNVASLNEALASGRVDYVLDRMAVYGVDDVVLLDRLSHADDLAAALTQNGFTHETSSEDVSYFHRDGQPRATIADWKALGIGKGALVYAYLFPQVIIGNSPYLDDYSLDELTRYESLVLAGFDWRNREAAEALARQAAERGVKVYVDMTRIPTDPVSQIPRFLDVWGETIILPLEPLLASGQQPIQLATFGAEGELWHTFTPQNLQYESLSFNYLGKKAVLAGYNQYGEGRVWFIGVNLAYHTLLQDDPQGYTLLSSILGFSEAPSTNPESLPLQDYQASASGYAFSYRLDADTRLLVPVARHDGATVAVDGLAVPVESLENMVVFAAPAGEHQVEIAYHPTAIYRIGSAVSILSALVLAGLALLPRWREKRRAQTGADG